MRYFSDYGMFTYLEEAERMWINCNSLRELESHLLFELVGTLLGIAIYNGIILDLHFPPVIYKKLQGCRTDLADLKDVEPSLARSLQSLLQYDGDVESTFCSTFQVLYDGTFSKLCNLSRNLSRNLVLRHKLHAKLQGVSCLAINKSRNIFVATTIARSRIRFYFLQRLRQRCNAFLEHCAV